MDLSKELKTLSERIFEAEKKISDFSDMLHAESKQTIHDNSEGLYDVAEVAGENSEGMFDLAEMVADLENRVTELEGKNNG
jgi:hypothetical protein